MNSFPPTRTDRTPGWLWKCGVTWAAAMISPCKVSNAAHHREGRGIWVEPDRSSGVSGRQFDAVIDPGKTAERVVLGVLRTSGVADFGGDSAQVIELPERARFQHDAGRAEIAV